MSDICEKKFALNCYLYSIVKIVHEKQKPFKFQICDKKYTLNAEKIDL